jgi:hypothetical protein
MLKIRVPDKKTDREKKERDREGKGEKGSIRTTS